MNFLLEPEQLTIKLEGAEQLWALKRRVRIPHEALVTVEYLPAVPTFQDYRGYLRFPGTAVP